LPALAEARNQGGAGLAEPKSGIKGLLMFAKLGDTMAQYFALRASQFGVQA
jgi:hypothetical protein